MKKIIDVLSVSVIAGLLVGLAFSGYEIITGNYIKYDILRLASLSLQEHLNRWTVLAVVVSIGVFAVLPVAKLVWRLFFSRMMEVHVRDKRMLAAFVVCCVFFVWVGWTVNHYWLPHKFERVSLFADVVILLFTVSLWFLLTRIRWAELYSLKLRGRIRKAALILLLCLLGLNISVGLGIRIDAHGCPNVILISIDTLRADHLGCYGYERNTTANIDDFAKENILFENCFVPEPTTAPSHMSMLTGLYPFTHGVDRLRRLDESITTLAEVLRAEGYRTLGFVRQCGQLRSECGFARGFDEYFEKSHREFKAELQNKFMIRHLKKSWNNKRKLFLFIHYYDVHSDFDKLPYDSPEPYNEMFYPDYEGDFTGGDGKLFASKYLVHVNENQVSLKEDDLKYITALYDGGITYTDKCIGDLFAALKKLGLYENSLIILTSDHGEEFQEHGWMLHSNPHYYEELVRVPLIVKLPGASAGGKVVGKLVESIDFMPTILSRLGIKNVPEMQGENFMRIIEDPEAEWKDTVFGYSVGEGPKAFVRDSRWKLVTSSLDERQGFKMFDLASDPLEKLDVAGNADGVTERLKAELIERYAKLKRPGKQKTVPMTVEERERLRSLGYVE